MWKRFTSRLFLVDARGAVLAVVPTVRKALPGERLLQGDECWEMRKNAAKKLGEEASTKILIPLMIMFVGIIVIVCTPAVLSISGM